MKVMLEDEGFPAATPKETLKQAYRAGWLEEESPWLEMHHDRNLSSHVYNEDIARGVFLRLIGYSSLLRGLHGKLAERIGL